MQIQTHVLSGWCVGNTVELTARERLFAMLAASLADLDGIGIFVDLNYYMKWHHVLCHNLLYGVLLSAVLTAWSTHRRKVFWVYLALFHLHLVLDYFGSGPGWGIMYWWPFSRFEYLNPRAWNLDSTQNTIAFGLFLFWTAAIYAWKKRTPLECLCPSFEKRLAALR